MATDLSVVLEDRPGTLASFTESLGKAGINMLGGCGVQFNGQGIVHILVDDAAATKQTLQGAGFTVRSEQAVLVTTVEDRPGALAKLARKLADASVNINLLYITTRGQVVLGVDDLAKARSVI